jgi:hypothetical protein
MLARVEESTAMTTSGRMLSEGSVIRGMGRQACAYFVPTWSGIGRFVVNPTYSAAYGTSMVFLPFVNISLTDVEPSSIYRPKLFINNNLGITSNSFLPLD